MNVLQNPSETTSEKKTNSKNQNTKTKSKNWLKSNSENNLLITLRTEIFCG